MILLFSNQYFYPDDYQKSIFEIDYQKLWKNGIRYLFLDVDNTLASYAEMEPGQKIIELFDEIKSLGMSMILLSNNHSERVRRFAEILGVPHVPSSRKPLKAGFKKALKKFPEASKANVWVIGDQFMTDVLGAKRMGLSVTVVDAIDRDKEKWFTKINRMMERHVLRRIAKANPDLYSQLHLDEKR